MWADILAAHVDAVSLTDGARRLTLRRGPAVETWQVRRLARTPRPSEIRTVPAPEVLWLPAATPALRERMRSLDLSWVTDIGEVHINAPWGVISGHAAREPDVPVAAPEMILSPGAADVLQYLVEHPLPVRQRQLATGVGRSQPRISQVLTALATDGLVRRLPSGWAVVDPALGFDVVSGRAEPAAGLATYWYGLDPPRAQIGAVSAYAGTAGVPIRLCGDWAADLLAPWRQPGLIVVHAEATLALEDVGFVPATAASASLLARIQPIRPAWLAAPEIVASLVDAATPGPLAPVTEVAREILAGRASDADQAVAELKRAWLAARERHTGAGG